MSQSLIKMCVCVCVWKQVIYSEYYRQKVQVRSMCEGGTELSFGVTLDVWWTEWILEGQTLLLKNY